MLYQTADVGRLVERINGEVVRKAEKRVG